MTRPGNRLVTHLKGRTLKRTTLVGLAGVCAGVALLSLPATAHSVERHGQTSQTSTLNAAKAASLTFTGGMVDGLYELTPSNSDHATALGTSANAGNFVQDDGWDQEAQIWTPGNELELHFLDADLSLGNLAFNNGKVTGTIVGPDGYIKDSTMNLAKAQARSEVDGANVTVTFTDEFGSQWILHFTLKVQG